MQDISSRVQQAEPEIEVPDSEEFGDLLNVLVQEMMSYPTEPPSVTTRPPTKNPTMKPSK